MHEAVAHLVLVWQFGLVAVLAVYAARSSSLMVRTLTLEVLSLVAVAIAAVLAMIREEAGYLTVALVLGLLGFLQTVMIARLAQGGRRNE